MPDAPPGAQPGAAPLLLHVFATFSVGGPQVRFAALANRFGRRWRHAIVAMDGNLACRARLDPTLDVSFPDAGVVKGDTLGNLRRFRRLLSTLRPAVLLTSNWGSIEWAMANRLPIVRHVHIEDGFGPEERDRQLPRRAWTRRLMLHGRDVILPSRTLLGIARDVWRLEPGRLHYVPNGIDLARFQATARHPAPDTPLRIGTVAGLRPEKNVARLVRAFARLRGGGVAARLAIAGDGPERPRLAVLAAELGVAAEVDFAGHLADPAAFLAALDVFALSSDTEQMPLSLLEAMAAGCAVAATDVGDVRSMLAPTNGAFVTGKDDAALAGAIGRLAADPALRHALGQANRARAEAEFGQESMFARWAALISP